MDKKHLSLLKQARKKIASLQEENDDLKKTAAEFQRQKLAEEIVNIKIAQGSTSPADFVDERDNYMESEKNLENIKVAFQEGMAPQEDQRLVEEDHSKEASQLRQSKDELPHIKQAQQELMAVMNEQ